MMKLTRSEVVYRVLNDNQKKRWVLKSFQNGCILLQQLLVMNNRGTRKESGAKKRELLNLRKKNEKIELIPGLNDDDSPLFNTLAYNREVNSSQRLQLETKKREKAEQDEFLLVQTNKIYHNNLPARQFQPLRGSTNKGKAPRASLNNLCKVEMEVQGDSLQQRPRSSQGGKLKMSEEIFRSNNDALNYQHRPGSSKSSRLFRRKGPFANDTINSENQESQPLIRVTGSGFNRAGTSYAKGKGRGGQQMSRTGTSLSSRQRGVQKVPGKIDPEFFRLFAQ